MSTISRGASLAILMTLTAGAAQAAITADQLWAAWQDAGGQAGVAVTAETETREGASLRLSGVTLSMTSPDDPATVLEAILEEVLLTEGADGTVTVTPSAELAMATGDEVDSLTLTLSHAGLQMVVAENLGEMTYDVTGESLVADFLMSMAGIAPMADGTTPFAETNVRMELSTPVITVVDTPNLNRTFAFNLSADSLSYDVTSSNPELGMNTVQSSLTEGLTIKGQFLAPASVPMAGLMSPEGWSAAFNDGMALTLQSTQATSTSSSRDENEFMPMEMTMVSLPGSSNASISKDGMSVDATGDGGTIAIVSPMLPFPQLDVGLGPLTVKFAMPFMSADTAGDFTWAMKLQDVVVNEEAWASIDPGASLPRDPAQIAIDTKGTMKLDVLAILAAEEAGLAEVAPPQPLTLEIPEVLVSAAGALLTGSGSFTFDNASGVPVPAGTADVTLTGGNALVDKLVAIGVLTEEDAGGARMMMAMFMNATGDDVLNSKIEAKADGSILVNGQRVQ